MLRTGTKLRHGGSGTCSTFAIYSTDRLYINLNSLVLPVICPVRSRTFGQQQARDSKCLSHTFESAARGVLTFLGDGSYHLSFGERIFARINSAREKSGLFKERTASRTSRAHPRFFGFEGCQWLEFRKARRPSVAKAEPSWHESQRHRAGATEWNVGRIL